MSIRLTCPNGHVLKVNESLAGRTGLCPACKARVQIPKPPSVDLDDEILGILGPQAPDPSPAAASDGALSAKPSPRLEVDSTASPKKSCFKCHHEIEVGIHICPHCHTYIAKLRDF